MGGNAGWTGSQPDRGIDGVGQSQTSAALSQPHHTQRPAPSPVGGSAGAQRARWSLGSMVGRSPAMERLFLQMRHLAGHLRVALVEGERGTGKDLLAATLHALGPQQRGLQQHLGLATCGATEFFAGKGMAERLEAARGGTLFLSEVDHLDGEGQARLLHLLGWMQEQASVHANARAETGTGAGGAAGVLKPAVVRAGQPLQSVLPDGRSSDAACPRLLLVSAERPLRPLVMYGRFRHDLLQQLGAVQLTLPALRDRREDIPMLVEQFVAQCAAEYGKPLSGIAPDVLPLLLAHPWPGNVAELRELIARAALRAKGALLQRADLLGGRAAALASSAPGTSPGASPASLPTMNRATCSATAGSGMRPLGSSAGQPIPVLTQRPHAPGYAASRPQASPLRLVTPGRGVQPTPTSQTEGLRKTEQGQGDPPRQCAAQADPNLDPNLDRAIYRHIGRVLGSVDGNKLRAAKLLGISRSTLYRLLAAQSIAGAATGSSSAREQRLPART